MHPSLLNNSILTRLRGRPIPRSLALRHLLQNRCGLQDAPGNKHLLGTANASSYGHAEKTNRAWSLKVLLILVMALVMAANIPSRASIAGPAGCWASPTVPGPGAPVLSTASRCAGPVPLLLAPARTVHDLAMRRPGLPTLCPPPQCLCHRPAQRAPVARSQGALPSWSGPLQAGRAGRGPAGGRYACSVGCMWFTAAGGPADRLHSRVSSLLQAALPAAGPRLPPLCAGQAATACEPAIASDRTGRRYGCSPHRGATQAQAGPGLRLPCNTAGRARPAARGHRARGRAGAAGAVAPTGGAGGAGGRGGSGAGQRRQRRRRRGCWGLPPVSTASSTSAVVARGYPGGLPWGGEGVPRVPPCLRVRVSHPSPWST